MSSPGLPLYQGNVNPAYPGNNPLYVQVTPGHAVYNPTITDAMGASNNYNQPDLPSGMTYAELQQDINFTRQEQLPIVGPLFKAWDWTMQEGSFDPKLPASTQSQILNQLTHPNSNAQGSGMSLGTIALVGILGAAAIFAIPALVKAFRD